MWRAALVSRNAARDESGFSLIELLVAATLMVVVFGAALALFDTTARIAPKDQERAHAIRDAQVGLHRMTRELRQADAVYAATATLVDVQLTIGGVSTRVVYDCNRPRCVRRAGAGTGPPAGQGELVLERLRNGTSQEPVFRYSPPGALPPNSVDVSVIVPASGDRGDGHRHSVVLEDGLALRNVNLAR